MLFVRCLCTLLAFPTFAVFASFSLFHFTFWLKCDDAIFQRAAERRQQEAGQVVATLMKLPDWGTSAYSQSKAASILAFSSSEPTSTHHSPPACRLLPAAHVIAAAFYWFHKIFINKHSWNILASENWNTAEFFNGSKQLAVKKKKEEEEKQNNRRRKKEYKNNNKKKVESAIPTSNNNNCAQISVIKCAKKKLLLRLLLLLLRLLLDLWQAEAPAIKMALGPAWPKRLQKMPKSSNTNELSFIRIMYDVVLWRVCLFTQQQQQQQQTMSTSRRKCFAGFYTDFQAKKHPLTI